jgi:hypothetical protein
MGGNQLTGLLVYNRSSFSLAHNHIEDVRESEEKPLR